MPDDDSLTVDKLLDEYDGGEGQEPDDHVFTEEEVRAGLARTVKRMRLHERMVDADYRERRVWLRRARQLEKRITLAELARLCGVREEAISQSLKKPDEAPPARSPARSNGKPPPKADA